ncbi:MAG: hypothetical protein WHT06_10645 [Desulfobacterales bacterium]
MGTPLLPLKSGREAGSGFLRLFPATALLLFLVPVAAGLAATGLAAFGFLPALGGTALSLAPFREFFSLPGLSSSIGLTLRTGFLAALLSLGIVLGLCGTLYETRLFALLRRLIAPLLSLPHAAAAIGLSFLIAPSGWLSRLLSPGLTGWQRPPDLALVHDPFGLSLIVGLLLKEIPYLLFMTFAALEPIRVREQIAACRALGHSPGAAWLHILLPQLYARIRLPVYAVLAFSLSVVDVAVILAPTDPPPLSVLLYRLFTDRDLGLVFPAAAGALLQLALTAAAIGLWRIAEHGVRWALRRLVRAGGAPLPRRPRAGFFFGAAALLPAALSLGGALALALWSFARSWFFPQPLPVDWTLAHWSRHAPELLRPAWTTFAAGFLAAGIGLLLALGCLQNERVNGRSPAARTLWLLYTPLLVPQIAFLSGLQILLVRLGIDGTWTALIGSHLLFAFPYIFLSLADPWRAFDRRYRTVALSLTGSPRRSFLRVELPLLRRAVLFSFAVGFAVSANQYLSTLFAGAGRLTTLTVEAVTLSSGNDPRVTGIYALAQAALPLGVFFTAVALGTRRRFCESTHHRVNRG